MRLPHKNIARVSCDTRFMGHLELRIRWWPSFSYLTQGQAKFRSKKSNFETQKFIFRTYLSCPVLSQDSKNVIFFAVQKIELHKKRFKKVTLSPLPGFWAFAQPKMKILVWNCVHLFVTHSSITHIFPFLAIYKILDFLGFYFWKIEILIFGKKHFFLEKKPKTKKKQKKTWPFCRAINVTSFGVY